jgi:hypothetical protein
MLCFEASKNGSFLTTEREKREDPALCNVERLDNFVQMFISNKTTVYSAYREV